MLLHPHGTGPGTAAAVRRGESLVQIDMNDVKAHVPRPGDPEKRVQVRAVIVKKPAVLMDEPCDSSICLLKRPSVLGLVSIRHATCSSKCCFRSSRSTHPWLLDLTSTT